MIEAEVKEAGSGNAVAGVVEGESEVTFRVRRLPGCGNEVVNILQSINGLTIDSEKVCMTKALAPLRATVSRGAGVHFSEAEPIAIGIKEKVQAKGGMLTLEGNRFHKRRGKRVVREV